MHRRKPRRRRPRPSTRWCRGPETTFTSPSGRLRVAWCERCTRLVVILDGEVALVNRRVQSAPYFKLALGRAVSDVAARDADAAAELSELLQ
jgi:hypothetical protein